MDEDLGVGSFEDDEGPHRVVMVGVGEDDPFNHVRGHTEFLELRPDRVSVVTYDSIKYHAFVFPDDKDVAAKTFTED